MLTAPCRMACSVHNGTILTFDLSMMTKLSFFSTETYVILGHFVCKILNIRKILMITPFDTILEIFTRSSLLLTSQRLKGYRCKSGIPLFAWRATWNCACALHEFFFLCCLNHLLSIFRKEKHFHCF